MGGGDARVTARVLFAEFCCSPLRRAASGAGCKTTTASAFTYSRTAQSTLITSRPPFAAPAPTRAAPLSSVTIAILHLQTAVSCEAAAVAMMRDIVLHDEDEDVRRYPWDGSSVMMERGDDTARSTLRGPSAACTSSSILDRVFLLLPRPPMNTPV